MQYIICYDIVETKIRTKVAKYLESFAHRVQYSVFRCDSSEERIHAVEEKLLALTENAEAPLLFIFPMCSTCIAKIWHVGKPREEKMFYIIA